MAINSSSVDPREIEQFTKIANLWWDPQGPFWPLHVLNEVRIHWILSRLNINYDSSEFQSADLSYSQPLAGLNVLDIGCGGGILSESLARLGATVTGIDVVERNIDIARSHAQQSNLNVDYRLCSVEDLAQTNSQYDIVFNMEVVEHVASLQSFMAAAASLVKPEGTMFVATINRNWLAWLVAIFGAEYILGWLPKGTHRYRMLRKPQEITQHLGNNGLKVQGEIGVKVNPLTKKMSTTSHMLINYMLHAKKV